jgi:ethanolaminephosphotransferase
MVDFFERADGTSSFFVSVSLPYLRICSWNTKLILDAQDFTEVDNNVTRHVPNELLNDDWNAMIMHYLGLDHIGHKAGPKRYITPFMLRPRCCTNSDQSEHGSQAEGDG